MRLFGSRKRLAYLGLAFALVTSAAIVVASAQAAPSKKKYDAFVVAADPNSTSFTLTLKNDGSSQQTLGSANFTAPSGWTVTGVGTVTPPAGKSWSVCLGAGGTTCGGGGVVQFRSASSGDALVPGESVSAVVTATWAGCHVATWSTSAKQSNDYSGTNNIFNPATLDVTPLGSFTTGAIASIIDLSTTPTVTFTATAKDTCGNTKTDYTGASFPYSGSTLSYTGLTGASPAATTGLTWSSGVGSITVTPAGSEIGNQFTITDNATGIFASSNKFDIVDQLCTSTTAQCAVDDHKYQDNGKAQTFVTTPPPSQGQLGLGFDNTQTDCGSATGTSEALVGSVVVIDPSSDVPGYQLTITYTKAAAHGLHPQDVTFCMTKSDDNTGWFVLKDCAKDVPAPCVASRSGTTGGGLQFILSLPQGDPHTGGFTP